MDIIVEYDSRNALAWVNKLDSCFWKLRFYSNKLHNMLSMLIAGAILFWSMLIERQKVLSMLRERKWVI